MRYFVSRRGSHMVWNSEWAQVSYNFEFINFYIVWNSEVALFILTSMTLTELCKHSVWSACWADESRAKQNLANRLSTLRHKVEGKASRKQARVYSRGPTYLIYLHAEGFCTWKLIIAARNHLFMCSSVVRTCLRQSPYPSYCRSPCVCLTWICANHRQNYNVSNLRNQQCIRANVEMVFTLFPVNEVISTCWVIS